jgi:enoyl-CoA hydratase/carnithine racemase
MYRSGVTRTRRREKPLQNRTIRFEPRGPAAWITLERPEVMNSLSPELLGELDAALAAAGSDAGIRVVVVTGSGRAFCAGADLSFALDALAGGEGGAALIAFVERAAAVLSRLEALPKPVIAAVNGLALAGGLELVLCCDLVVAAESARIGDVHANYGLLPGAGGAVRLARKIGPTRAKHLLFTGEMVPASELVTAGLVNSVVPDGELVSAVDKLVGAIAEKSPLGLGAMKRLVAEGLEQPLDAALRLERDALAAHVQSQDLREGLAAFREKRKPRFEGR